MKNLIPTSPSKTQTMSSLEIAELTGKRHTDVREDIYRILAEVGIEDAPFSAPCKMPSGQTAKVYNLPKRECDLVVSGYSAKYRLAIIDRWQELEKTDGQPLTEIERAEKNAQLALEHVRILKLNKQLEVDNKELAITLDKEGQWSSIKRQEKLHNKTFMWRELTAWHNEHGIERKEVFDQNYGTVKSYCAEAWLDIYNITL